jgi:Pyruvate/2-oxoacid:ferredoxin oxidoreductase delta subunit
MIVCFCAGDEEILPTFTELETVAMLMEAGMDVLVEDDLCRLAAIRADRLKELPMDAESAILSPYTSRVVRSLFAFAGASLDPEVTIVSLRRQSGREALRAILGQAPPPPTPEHVAQAEAMRNDLPAASDSWRPWYPVIDYDRCAHCGQCLHFCIFGVYERTGEEVHVAQPAACKNNCPACARICPQGAILFPMHPDPLIHGENKPGKIQPDIDLSEKIQGDVLEVLRQRQESQDEEDVQKAKERAWRKLMSLPVTGPSRPCACEKKDARKDIPPCS